jgi:hypothetical protein
MPWALTKEEEEEESNIRNLQRKLKGATEKRETPTERQ